MERTLKTPALPLPPMPSSWGEYRLDPLASLVADMVAAAESYRFSEGHYMAIASFAERVEFDPDALIPVGWAEARVSPLLNVLLYEKHHHSPTGAIKWPDTPEGFKDLSFSDKQTPHPAEWVAAMLLARGANPWAGGEVGVDRGLNAGKSVRWGYPTVNAPIFQALRHAMVGLAQRMMQMPGAPSLERLAHDPTEWMSLGIRDVAAVNESWLHRVASEKRLLPVLEWFLDEGVRPRQGGQFHPLEQACPEALEVFRERDLLPSDKATQRRLLSAWRARAKSGDLSTKLQTRMAATLEGRVADPGEALASEMMVLLTKTPWGSIPAARAEQDNYACNVGEKKLVQRAEVTSGALLGNWSYLAALIVNRLRQTRPGPRNIGLLRFDLDVMLGKEDAAKPGPRLAEAIGFEWRPGITMDGLVALALLGNSLKVPGEGVEEKRKEFEQDAAHLGVLDPYGWAREHAPSAIAFTSTFMARGSALAFDALFLAWERALMVDPDLLGDDQETKISLLAALTGNFSMADKNRTIKAAQLVAPWWPPFDEYRAIATFPALEALASSEVSLALEVALATRSKQWLDGIRDGVQYLSGKDATRIAEWVSVIKKSKTQSRPDGMEALEALVAEQKMIKTLPETTSETPRTGNRARL